MVEVQNPSELPEPQNTNGSRSPTSGHRHNTGRHLGNIITLLTKKRGMQEKMDYLNETRVMLEYSVPMNEIVVDFYDKLKSLSKGYASFDYEPSGYREGDLVKLDVRVAGDVVDALSVIVPRSAAEYRGRELVKNMKEIVPRQLFEVAIQASTAGSSPERRSNRWGKTSPPNVTAGISPENGNSSTSKKRGKSG